MSRSAAAIATNLQEFPKSFLREQERPSQAACAEQFDITREQVEAILEFVTESLRSEVPTSARPV